MTLNIAGQTHCGFLTNSHVVAPPEGASAELKKRYDICGVSLDNDPLDPVRTRIHWMTVKDIDATKHAIKKERKACLDTAQDLEANIAECEEMGRNHRAQDRRLDVIRKGLDSTDSATRLCSSMPRAMGDVLSSTGRGLSATGYIRDTAFVKVPEADPTMWNHCLDSNKLLKSTAAGLSKKLPGDYCHRTDGQEDVHRNPSAITGIGPLLKGSWYFKLGRTTDIITGICHGTEAYVNLGGGVMRTKYDTLGRKGAYEDVGFTTEYVILGSQTKTDEREGGAHPFCDSGDAGSFIIDHNGEVVAQLFGFIKGMCGPSSPAGLVTPMDRIVKDVELMSAPKDVITGQRIAPGAVLDVPW